MTREEAARILEKQFDKSCGNYRYQNKDKLDYEDALWMAIAALRAQQEAEKNEPLKTTWETPETCPHCMEHLSKEWSFCPECGHPTDWSEYAALSPCNFCVYNPPSSFDGKPCCMCPARGKNEREDKL